MTALRDKRSTVVAQLKKLQSETEPIIKIFENQTVVEQIESTRDGRDLFQYLEKEHNVCSNFYISLVERIKVLKVTHQEDK